MNTLFFIEYWLYREIPAFRPAVYFKPTATLFDNNLLRKILEKH